MPSRRRRDRSKTPEVNWATLPGGPDLAAAEPEESRKRPRSEEKTVPDVAESASEVDKEIALEAARHLEKVAWRTLVVKLAALRGDPKVEELLKEKHPELLGVPEKCGALGKKQFTLTEAKDAAKAWFARGLKGSSRHGPMEKANLCQRLTDSLKEHSAFLLRGTGPALLAQVLKEGRLESEGPLVATAFTKELEGSRYEGLWISRDGKGSFILGDDQEGSGLPACDDIGATIAPRIRVLPQIVNDQLVVDKFFQDGEDVAVPARVAVGPFLSVYFEGLSLKQAVAKWKENAGQRAANAAGKKPAMSEQDKIKALAKTLPPGWELRESRSKKGVYYYANPSKGLSQNERPKA